MCVAQGKQNYAVRVRVGFEWEGREIGDSKHEMKTRTFNVKLQFLLGLLYGSWGVFGNKVLRGMLNGR